MIRQLRYEPKYWVQPQHDSVRAISGLSHDEAIERAGSLRERYGYLGRRIICRNKLDNPYMTEDARACIVNELLREYQAPGRNWKRERLRLAA